MPVLATIDPYWLFLGSAALLLIWGMLRMRQRRGQAPAAPSAVEQIERDRQVRGLRGDLEQVMVEVERVAKQFSADIDAKSARLEKLIAEVDERIARLEQLEVVKPAREPDPIIPSEPPSTSEGDIARQVYRLADAGHNSLEIARALGEHVGKVELILALREGGRGEGRGARGEKKGS